MGRKRKNNQIPAYDKFFIPTLESLISLGGSGSIQEINEKVYEIENLDEEILDIPHNDKGLESAVDYKLAWARTYLKKYGLIENSSRGVWSLIDNDLDISTIVASDIKKFVIDQNASKPKTQKSVAHSDENNTELKNQVEWKEELVSVLQNIEPSAFERLCQRLLRESGFVQVEVTGKSSDGGIDGKGIVRISGFLSFHVIFQSKRYKGSVGSSQIRDFRGAMQGRADKGLFITTGTFTREAMKEATRDGAPPIEMIDGDLLCDKLKELKLGVKTELIEEIKINTEWFDKI
jgi:restriction system protein